MNVETLPRRDSGPGPGERDPRPLVAPPNAGLPGIAIAAIAAMLAILLFFVLDSQRTRTSSEFAQAKHPQAGFFAPPPPLVVPPEPELEARPIPAPVITIPIQTRPAPAPQRRMWTPSPVIVPIAPAPPPPAAIVPQPVPQTVPSRLAESALVYDAGAPWEEGAKPSVPPAAVNPPAGAGRPAAIAQPAARPTRIANLATVVPTGTLIRAVLETPIDTSRPGMIRAIVSKDTRGFNGRHVLIPRGSRLIGEYDADVRTGQKKVLVSWTQLIRPDGSVIRLDSPGADAMGGAGLPGRVNSFFFQRFFNAVLQTALNVGGSLATWSIDAPVVIGLPNAAVTNVAGQSGGLIGQTPQPKITVRQGTAFNVFVARDLDFSGAPLRR